MINKRRSQCYFRNILGEIQIIKKSQTSSSFFWIIPNASLVLNFNIIVIFDVTVEFGTVHIMGHDTILIREMLQV